MTESKSTLPHIKHFEPLQTGKQFIKYNKIYGTNNNTKRLKRTVLVMQQRDTARRCKKMVLSKHELVDPNTSSGHAGGGHARSRKSTYSITPMGHQRRVIDSNTRIVLSASWFGESTTFPAQVSHHVTMNVCP